PLARKAFATKVAPTRAKAFATKVAPTRAKGFRDQGRSHPRAKAFATKVAPPGAKDFRDQGRSHGRYPSARKTEKIGPAGGHAERTAPPARRPCLSCRARVPGTSAPSGPSAA